MRFNIVDYNNSGGIAIWKANVHTALSLGFDKIIWGCGAGTTHITASNWTDYSLATQTIATWFQAQNDPRLELQIGNEEELHHDGSISDATLRANLRSLAATCQGIYTLGYISYASSTASTEIAAWASEGLGALDKIGFNLYSSDTVFKSNAAAIVGNFGAAGYVAEWGTSNGFADFHGSEDLYAQAISRRRAALANTGITESYFYNFMESNNKWGAKTYPITGNFRTAWPRLLGARAWFIGNPNLPVVRSAVSARQPSPARVLTPHRAAM